MIYLYLLHIDGSPAFLLVVVVAAFIIIICTILFQFKLDDISRRQLAKAIAVLGLNRRVMDKYFLLVFAAVLITTRWTNKTISLECIEPEDRAPFETIMITRRRCCCCRTRSKLAVGGVGSGLLR